MQIDEFFTANDNNEAEYPMPFAIPKDWTQGRTAFGGLSAGILFYQLKGLVEEGRPLRSITFNFVGPLEAGQAFSVNRQVLRQGKNATQITGNLVQDGKVALSAIACFAQNRQSKVTVEPIHETDLQLPKKAKYIPQIPKVTPKFLRHVDLSISEGKLPFTGSKTAKYSGWMRFKETPQRFDDEHIITLIDAWPPTILQMVMGPAPASTMSWNMEFIHPFETIAPGQWLGYEADTISAHGGYGHSEAKIWSESGELVAISRQLIAIFD